MIKPDILQNSLEELAASLHGESEVMAALNTLHALSEANHRLHGATAEAFDMVYRIITKTRRAAKGDRS